MPRMTYDLTRAQRKNLRKLADYLETLPFDYKHFDMKAYTDANPDSKELIEYGKHNGGFHNLSCGTVACAIGHGPSAGVYFRGDDFDREGNNIFGLDWNHYAEHFVIDEAAFGFMFGGAWTAEDNHHWGAAARIRYVLAGNGLPLGFHAYGYGFSIASGTSQSYAEFRKVPA